MIRFPKNGKTDIELNDKTLNISMNKIVHYSQTITRQYNFKTKSFNKYTNSDKINIKISEVDDSNIEISIIPTCNGMTIQTSTTQPKRKLSNYFLRMLQYNPEYPLKIIGSTNRTKEMLEVASSIYYIRKVIEKITYDEDKGTHQSKIHDILDNEKTLCIIPGDGKYPRAGYMFSLITKWQVVSIDPIMNQTDISKLGSLPSNLQCITGSSEDFDFDPYVGYNIVLVHIHSHANFENMWSSLEPISKLLIGYSLPCCKGYVHTLSNDSPYLYQQFTDPELSQVTDKSEVFIYLKQE